MNFSNAPRTNQSMYYPPIRDILPLARQGNGPPIPARPDLFMCLSQKTHSGQNNNKEIDGSLAEDVLIPQQQGMGKIKKIHVPRTPDSSPFLSAKTANGQKNYNNSKDKDEGSGGSLAEDGYEQPRPHLSIAHPSTTGDGQNNTPHFPPEPNLQTQNMNGHNNASDLTYKSPIEGYEDIDSCSDLPPLEHGPHSAEGGYEQIAMSNFEGQC